MAPTYFITLSLTILFFCFTKTVTSAPEQELNSMLEMLRSRGYNLFGNAISTSGIDYDVISGDTFTFFAPIDSSLFALDMTATASDYVTSLRNHIVPGLLSASDLGTFPSGYSLKTLAPNRTIRIDRRQSLPYDVVTVDGVEIVLPGLFSAKFVVVHGLGGILRSNTASPQSSPVNSTANHTNEFSIARPPSNYEIGAPEPASIYGISPAIGFEPPINADFPPVPEPAYVRRFPPMNSPEIAGSIHHISPANNPPPPHLAPRIEAPASYFSSPSSGGNDESSIDMESMLNSLVKVSNDPEMMRKDEMAGAPDKFWPLGVVDCPLTDHDIPHEHVSSGHPGYLYTRQHFAVSTITCGRA